MNSGQNNENSEYYAAKIVPSQLFSKRREKEMDSCNTKSSSTKYFKGYVKVWRSSWNNTFVRFWGRPWTQSNLYDHWVARQVSWGSVSDLVLMRLHSSKRFTISSTYNIGIQIITRLEQIHRKGFVHRDIKANNFMIGRGEKAQTVYIIDFGLAKRYFDPKTNKHIPVKGGKSLVGTARYASIASHEGF